MYLFQPQTLVGPEKCEEQLQRQFAYYDWDNSWGLDRAKAATQNQRVIP